MRKLLALLTVVLMTTMVATAQNRAITGKVTDEKGQPVEGATIQIKGSSTGVAADAQGNFRISAKTGDVLTISATNFGAREVTVTAQNFYTVSLTRQAGTIDEVVVTTALGIRREARQLGAATATVNSKELTQAKVVNLQNGLTGKVSGLNVATTNSSVFGDTRLTLRGIRSLTGNNQPMLVLDGVPLGLGFLSSINPNDIENVSILKSSSATAVYGPDGVNGAIVITTKRGNRNRPVVTLSHTLQLEKISYMPKFQTRFGGGYAQDAFGNGTFEPIEQQSWGDEFDGSIRQFGQTGPNGEKLEMPYAYNKNGRRNFFATGITNQTDLSYSTGGFYISAQNVSVEGTMPGDKMDRRSVVLKADQEYGKFRAGFNLRYTNMQYDITNNNQQVYYAVTSSPGNYDLSMFKNWRAYYSADPTQPNMDWFSTPDGYYSPYIDNNGKTPYFAKDNYRERGISDDLFGNGELNFKATNWLNFTYRVGLTLANAGARSTRGAFNYSAFHNTLRDHGTLNITSGVNNSSTLAKRITSEIFATFNKKFGDFGVNALLGQSYREISQRIIQNGSNNLGTATLYSIALRKGEPTVNFDSSKTRLERYFGSIGFSYKNWAFIEATGSYDIDSRLVKPGSYTDKSDISFFYPGVNGSIVLTDAIESLKGNRTLSYAKVRGAISKTGNVNLPAYAFENTFVNSTFFPYGDVLGFQATLNTAASSYEPEFVINKEVGIELGLLRNKVNFEATYFHQDNTNQVIDVQLSNTTGATTAKQNAASFINQGVEFDLKLTPLMKFRNVNIDLKMNYTYITNKVTALVDGVNELGIGNFNYAIVGQSAYMFKLPDYVRDDQGRVIVDKTTGMPEANPNLTMFGYTMP